MFAKLKHIFNSEQPMTDSDNNAQAEIITEELTQLEANLADNPADNDTQKNLMVKYNQAIKIYSSNKMYRDRVDDIFLKIDELRNTIRKNI
ncbi:hypothetical protein [Klebsiella sp. BIGb0407]|uniref:hypothetical protein n=1 Tax=Klebsiella sp. BIGb0407 TaxID=2940603 RepID=UPI002168DF5D|nr:hypothetical protein [Klebsiella sp. BIGb0407]MCS3430995.1 chromosome condensin MukBEF ATPase and DNA-binding subunit MukB [Klebsiella sp. BIGb0407]